MAVAVDSEDPYWDFRAYMEEMVAAHGLRGWEVLPVGRRHRLLGRT